jgi:hypothetical protein
MHYFGVPNSEASIILHWAQNNLWECYRAFLYPSTRKRCLTCVSSLNAQFRSIEVVKHSFYSIGPKIMSETDSEHFAHLRHVKRCKTCVSGLNALFWGTKVAKHPFYSIGPKIMFGSVSEHFANLRHVKWWKLVSRAWMHYFTVPKLWNIHSIPLDTKWYLGVLRSTSLTFCM